MSKSPIRLLVLLALLSTSIAEAAITLNLRLPPEDTAAFIHRTAGMNETQWLDAWRSWENQTPETASIYSKVFNSDNSGWEQKKSARLHALFQSWSVLEAGMVQAATSAPTTLENMASKFNEHFPDTTLEVPVYLLPSAMGFNGKVILEKSGESVLLLGIDVIAQRNDNLDVLAAHELFHVLHFGRLGGSDHDAGLFAPLWAEGLATYASGVFAPAPQAELLMDPELAIQCGDARNVADWAREFLRISTLTGRDIDQDYRDWFKLGGTSSPKRRGYCLGMKLAERLASKHPLTELTRWSAKRIEAEMRAGLKELAERSDTR